MECEIGTQGDFVKEYLHFSCDEDQKEELLEK